jgi:hypothetical protein
VNQSNQHIRLSTRDFTAVLEVLAQKTKFPVRPWTTPLITDARDSAEPWCMPRIPSPSFDGARQPDAAAPASTIGIASFRGSGEVASWIKPVGVPLLALKGTYCKRYSVDWQVS